MSTRPNRTAQTLLATAVLLALSGCRSSNEVASTPPPEEPAVLQERSREQESRRLESLVVNGARVRSAGANAIADVAYAPAPPPAPPAPSAQLGFAAPSVAAPAADFAALPEANTERYADVPPNPVQRVAEQPVSTFSIDVDTGSYSNLRRMIGWGQRPPADAVRVEELLNYFDYADEAPASRSQPFAVHTEVAPAPWNARRLLMRVALKAYEVPATELPPSNLVFLVDTSGSMQDADKLPLVKQALRELVLQMRPQDRIALVVYAGSAGLVLPPTSGAERATILEALDRLEAGGSTNGGAGIELAYRIAREAKIDGGVNRIVLATDGDFNVGTTDQTTLEAFVAEQRKHGIALSTLGFGQGNYNDAMAEQLANIGDGNHAYIDSPREARKVLRDEMAGTLLTVAKDVKIQVEFNPAQVAEYRLVGYENRQLKREDFANDAVDAGEIGAGHDVTALYEIALVGSGGEWNAPLKYAAGARTPATGAAGELATVRLRYKAPEGGASRLLERPVRRADIATTASPALQWAAAVTAYGERLRGGEALGGAGWPEVARWVDAAFAAAPDARDAASRDELRRMVRQAATLDGESLPEAERPALAVSE
ncbi:VWA domain-containing protein [Silanimonas sp.]|uniref:vWA domain-containing protein n=1 Tax=Silanimonas sp. TaxID=1929290 RepID=UPI0022BFAE12|nr:VWA domain-containing protein [Silanimonas sp.]MCZ8061408.1 VWA domain-containing protein [Silanimonas sp.]